MQNQSIDERAFYRGVLVMLPPRRAFPIMIAAWLLNAVPILSYLLAHLEELWTPRGQEMFMSYGLAILLLLVLLPFQHRARLQLERLQHDNSHMHNLAERDAFTVAERLRTAINNDLFPPVGKLTASGGATSRRDSDTLENLIARADKALYQAKLKGRDQIVCD